MGDWLIGLMIGGFLLMYFVGKIVRTVDEDGEMGKSTSEGFAKCIERLFK